MSALTERVCAANLLISEFKLAPLTWGNASEADREAGVIAIKPSGVPYPALSPDDISLVSLETGELLAGKKPSSDTPTHLELYRAFPRLGGIAHAHSRTACAWAQAMRDIPCLGTTHADTFYGRIPCARLLTPDETASAYEASTGRVIAELFIRNGLDPLEVSGVLAAMHGPFAFGTDAKSAVENALTLEECAAMALYTELLSGGNAVSLPDWIAEKHYLRKHGADAYYGQLSGGQH